MEGRITTTEMDLMKLKRVVNMFRLNITFLSYTRLQPNTPIGYSQAEVLLTYTNVDDVFKLGLLVAGEGKELTLGPVTILFP